MKMEQDGESREDEGLETESDGGWYFDLPNGAWERQEAKNRQLRQSVRDNIDESVEAAPPDPFKGKSRGLFGRQRKDEEEAGGGRSIAGGKWTLNRNQGSIDDSAAPDSGAAPRAEAPPPPPAGDDLFASFRKRDDEPAGPAGEYSTEPLIPRRRQLDDQPAGWQAPAGDDGETDSLSMMRSWALSRGESGGHPEPFVLGGSKPQHHVVLPPVTPQREETPPEEAPVTNLRDWALRHRSQQEADEAPAPKGEGDEPTRWDEMFGAEPAEGGATLDSMRAWATGEMQTGLVKADDDDDAPREVPAEFLKPFEWEDGDGTGDEAAVASDSAPTEEQDAAAPWTLHAVPAEEDLPAPAEEPVAEPAWEPAAATVVEMPGDDDERAWEPSATPIQPLTNSWATMGLDDETVLPGPESGAEEKKPGLMGRLFGRKKKQEQKQPEPAEEPTFGDTWTLADEELGTLAAARSVPSSGWVEGEARTDWVAEDGDDDSGTAGDAGDSWTWEPHAESDAAPAEVSHEDEPAAAALESDDMDGWNWEPRTGAVAAEPPTETFAANVADEEVADGVTPEPALAEASADEATEDEVAAWDPEPFEAVVPAHAVPAEEYAAPALNHEDATVAGMPEPGPDADRFDEPAHDADDAEWEARPAAAWDETAPTAAIDSGEPDEPMAPAWQATVADEPAAAWEPQAVADDGGPDESISPAWPAAAAEAGDEVAAGFQWELPLESPAAHAEPVAEVTEGAPLTPAWQAPVAAWDDESDDAVVPWQVSEPVAEVTEDAPEMPAWQAPVAAWDAETDETVVPWQVAGPVAEVTEDVPETPAWQAPVASWDDESDDAVVPWQTAEPVAEVTEAAAETPAWQAPVAAWDEESTDTVMPWQVVGPVAEVTEDVPETPSWSAPVASSDDGSDETVVPWQVSEPVAEVAEEAPETPAWSAPVASWDDASDDTVVPWQVAEPVAEVADEAPEVPAWSAPVAAWDDESSDTVVPWQVSEPVAEVTEGAPETPAWQTPAAAWDDESDDTVVPWQVAGPVAEVSEEAPETPAWSAPVASWDDGSDDAVVPWQVAEPVAEVTEDAPEMPAWQAPVAAWDAETDDTVVPWQVAEPVAEVTEAAPEVPAWELPGIASWDDGRDETIVPWRAAEPVAELEDETPDVPAWAAPAASWQESGDEAGIPWDPGAGDEAREPASIEAYRAEHSPPPPVEEDDPWASFIAARRASGESFPKGEVSADNNPAGRDVSLSGDNQDFSTPSYDEGAATVASSDWTTFDADAGTPASGAEEHNDDPWAAVAAASGYGGAPDEIAVYRGHTERSHTNFEAAETARPSWGDELAHEPAPEWAGEESDDDVVLRAFYAHASADEDDNEPVEVPWGREETQAAFGPILGSEAADLVDEVSGSVEHGGAYSRPPQSWMAPTPAPRVAEPAGWGLIPDDEPFSPFERARGGDNEPPWGPPAGYDFDSEAAPAARGHGRTKTLVREIVETVLLAVLVFLCVRASFQNFKVDGTSMYPTLDDGQFLIVNKLVYAEVDTGKLGDFLPFIGAGEGSKHIFHGPERGDIVVLKDPRNPDTDLIKRVIGLPGDTIEIRAGRVYINDFLLEEPYIKQEWHGNMAKIRIAEGEFFVMGDNRENSLDSRSSMVGLIGEELIIGKAMFSYWPTSHLGLAPNGSPELSDKPTLTTQRIDTP
ncbi:MAG: signal peptidase I [Dehalococcoidia bacterium]|nr:signal peptidase I [Dehalococcoidia bacterium]